MIHLKALISSLSLLISLVLVLICAMFILSPLFGAPLVYIVYGLIAYVISKLLKKISMTPKQINDYLEKYKDNE